MALSVKHDFQSLKSDGVDNSLVQPSNWNEEHVITMGAFTLIGRGSGAGAAQEIPFETVGVPVGAILDYAGSVIPSKYLLCAGQNVSRATYADLFTKIGTQFGVGDGSSTFGVPDLRGRVTAGADNMGGSAANRLTGTTMSPNGNTLGAGGGAQTESASVTGSGSATGTVPALTVGGTNLGDYSLLRGANGTDGPLVPQNGATSTIVGTTGPSGITLSTSITGNTATVTNVQPTQIMNKIIKALAV